MNSKTTITKIFNISAINPTKKFQINKFKISSINSLNVFKTEHYKSINKSKKLIKLCVCVCVYNNFFNYHLASLGETPPKYIKKKKTLFTEKLYFT